MSEINDTYTFRREYTDLYGQTKTVEVTTQGETLPEILEDFVYFLNGCSFTYVKDIIFVKESGEEVSVLDYEQPDEDEPTTVTELSEAIERLSDIVDSSELIDPHGC